MVSGWEIPIIHRAKKRRVCRILNVSSCRYGAYATHRGGGLQLRALGA